MVGLKILRCLSEVLTLQQRYIQKINIKGNLVGDLLQGLAFPALGRLKSGNKIRVPAFYNLIKLVSGWNLAKSFISCKRIFQ